MPGPIIRSGPTNEYQSNWDAAFGDGKPSAKKKKAAVKRKPSAAAVKKKKK